VHCAPGQARICRVEKFVEDAVDDAVNVDTSGEAELPTASPSVLEQASQQGDTDSARHTHKMRHDIEDLLRFWRDD
jgi:hypothetical protein